MNHRWMLSLVIALLSLVFAPSRAFSLPCLLSNEDLTQLRKQANDRIRVLENLEGNLIRFHQGVPLSLPPDTLFVVALNDPDAVAQRVKYLQAAVQLSPKDAISKHPMYPCLGLSESEKIKEKKPGDTTSDDHSPITSPPEANADLQTLQKLVNLETRVSRLRLDFLILSEERRETLIQLQFEATRTQKQLHRLGMETDEAEKSAQTAEVSKKEAESLAQVAETSSLRDLATERAILEQYRMDLADAKISLNRELIKYKDKARQQTEDLTKFAAVLSRLQLPRDELLTTYRKLLTLWRQLADDTLKSLTHQKDQTRQNVTETPPIPPAPTEILESLTNHKDAKEYRLAYEAALLERQAFQKSRDYFEDETNGSQYRLLLTAGRIRTQSIYDLTNLKIPEVLAYSDEYFEDLSRELRLIPYRPLVLAQMGLLEGRELVQSGVAGILTLLKRLFLLTGFLVMPLLAFAFLRSLSTRIDKVRKWVLNPSNRIKQGPQIAQWIQRINPFLPWIMMSFGALLASRVVKGTDLEFLTELLPYFYYYFIYKMFLILTMSCSVALIDRLPTSLLVKKNRPTIVKRFLSTANLVGRFLLASAYVLHATESIGRTGLVYHLVWELITLLVPLALATAAYRWRLDLGLAALVLLPPKIGETLNSWCQSRVLAILASPATAATIVISLAFEHLYRNASRLDSAKKISAQIFRRKLEAAAQESPGIPLSTPNLALSSVTNTAAQTSRDAYGRFFERGPPPLTDLLMVPQGLDIAAVRKTINHWIAGSTIEHALIIHGPKGSGKSSALRLIEAPFSNVMIRRLAIPQKVLTRKGLRALLGELLTTDLSAGETSLCTYDQQAPKTLVLLDDCQNLFLAERGGFEAFHELTDLMRADTKNLFWCAAFNRYSWLYLEAVTRSTGTFRWILPLYPWRDDDIKTLILRRHERSGYTLNFDPILYSSENLADNEQLAYIKDRFFQLLWEQSRGNPRTAIVLWLSALNVASGKNLQVGLPTLYDSRQGEKLTDDELFVYASVIRHENLTPTEACLTTNLPANLVRRALAVGLDQEYLECDSQNRYRIHPVWQAVLTQHLINKNFVYE